MSGTDLASAFASHEARYAAQVIFDTFGHLEPKPNVYRGWIVFIHGTHGDVCAVDWDFGDVQACPGIYEDMNDWMFKQVEKPPWSGKRPGRAAEVGVYKFVGTYTRFKNGNGRFGGKITKVRT